MRLKQRELPAAVEYRSVASLKPYAGNARTHSKKQIKQIAASIERFGFTNPVLIGDDGLIVAGHGRIAAAKLLGLDAVPVLPLSHLSEAERRAYVIADNKLALNAGWDMELLATELQGLLDIQFDVELTGFSLAEIDIVLDGSADSDPDGPDGREDEIPPLARHAVTREGDLWVMGRHRLLCGNARIDSHYGILMGGAPAGMIFTDPPYNVPIDGHVCGSGRVRHREFAMGAGEMSREQFTLFLSQTLQNMTLLARSGAILFVCMDWRHMGELLEAGRMEGLELKNVCVWNKTNGGMGTFYRSKHELVFVFKFGADAHINSFGLGDTGRYRTNVWDYPGISSISATRGDELAMHPTVKPVALVADAIRDCSKRGDVILDPFGGSGTTLIAAHKTGRVAHVMELDPLYCDTIIRRYEAVTGKRAILAETGDAFDDVAASRLGFQAGEAA